MVYRARTPVGQELAAGSWRGKNVLLITIDTLRADRLAAYGGHGLTPALDDLAARGAVFTRAYTHAPMTLPAHVSLLTGLTPRRHGVLDNGYRLSSAYPTLASRLREAGYRTGAFVGAFVLDARFGLNQGFDVYDDRYGPARNRGDFHFVERRANSVLDAAQSWILGSAATPWFAWVHLFDPHAPYDAPERLVSDPYDNEVAFTDAALARFLRALDARGRLTDAVVIVTADHGESLGDHGETTHGLFAYEATLRVPLLIVAPRLHHGTYADRPVVHSDVMPTLLDLLGHPSPAGLDGLSLRATLNGETEVERSLYFEALDAHLTRNWAPLRGIVNGGWKYIDLPVPELYDVIRDADETENRVDVEKERVRSMQRELARYLADSGAPASRPKIDTDAGARLRALGYATPQAAPAVGKTYTAADDPKTLLPLHRLYTRALELAAADEGDGALSALREIVAKRPDFRVAYLNAAAILLEKGRPGEALDWLDRAKSHGIEDDRLTERRAAALLAASRPAEAAALLRPLVAAANPDVDVLNTAAVAASESGHPEEARRLFERALAADSSSGEIWHNLGLLELSAANRAAAARAFEQAVSHAPDYAEAWRALGAARAATDPDAAVSAWTRVLALDPRDLDTLYNTGMLLFERGRLREAMPLLERFAAEAPVERYAADRARVRAALAEIRARRPR